MLKDFPPLAGCFAFDVQKADTRSGFKPAEEHLGSDHPNPMYAIPRIEGYAALLRLTDTRIVIPGKDERRYKDEKIVIDGILSPMWQGYLIKKMLVEDYGCDGSRIDWIPSTGTTGNAAEALRIYFQEHDIAPVEGTVEFVTSFYHCNRSGRVALRRAGLPRLLTPAECFTVAEAIQYGKMEDAEARLQSFGGHFSDVRIIDEIRGIALDLLNEYQAQTKNW